MDTIKTTDADEKLEMVSYIDCNNQSPEEIKKNRGVVIDKVSKIEIFRSFGYTDQFVETEMEEIQNALSNLEDWNFFYSLEATLIRVAHYEGQWYIMTHKKLDAFKSRWSCRDTFGDLFESMLSKMLEIPKTENPLQKLYDQLDVNKVYCFLLKSNFENRIVCQYNYKQERIVYLGCFDKGDVVQLDTNIPDKKIFELFARPVQVYVTDLEDLIKKVNDISFFDYQGIVATHKVINKQIKIYNSEYYKFYELRGNNPNLRFRYLELRNDPEKLKMLYFLYPKSADIFDQYEDTLHKISRMIYHFYVNRYIKNQFITLPKEEFVIMKKCHDWYLTDRQKNRIFSKRVMEFLMEEPPLNLYKMIRRFNLNQNLAFHQNVNNKRIFLDTDKSKFN
jgi:hypothetical protein